MQQQLMRQNVIIMIIKFYLFCQLSFITAYLQDYQGVSDLIHTDESALEIPVFHLDSKSI